MRQNFLMRLFIAFLVLGLLSWGESVFSLKFADYAHVSATVYAQEEGEEGDADVEEGEEDADAEEEELGEDEEYVDEEGEEDAEGAEEDVSEDENADGEGGNAEENAVMVTPVPVAPSVPAGPAIGPSLRTVDGFGGYAAVWKILAAIVVYLVWVFALDWASTDCFIYSFNAKKWVPIIYGSFWGGMILFWLIPFFWVSYLFLLVGTIVPIVMFVKMHNQDLSSGEQVMTPEHLRFVFSQFMRKFGVKIAAKARDRHEIGFPAILHPYGKNKVDTEQWRIQARAHDGFPNAREILSKLLVVHPEGLMLDYTATGVSSRFLLDGVWNASEGFTRELADPALQALKILCGMKPEDRKNKQEGTFRVEFEYDFTFPEDRLNIKHAEEALRDAQAEDNKALIREKERDLERVKEAARAPEKRKREIIIHLTTQGVQSGERAILMFEQGKSPFKSMEELGMTAEMAAKLKQETGGNKGVFVFAAPASNGLRTTVKMALLKTDRYTREFYEVEDGIHEYDEVENVTKVPIHTKDMEEWRGELRNLFLKDPNVVVVRDIPSKDVLDDILEEVENEDRFIITTSRSKDAAEALLRIMATKCDPQKWAKHVHGVLCQRLIRKLCEHCKEAYVPPVETLKQIGAKEKIKLYRQPAPVQPKPGEPAPEPCPECRGLGYSGRTAMFELIVVGEETRKALLTTPKLEAVRLALKKDGNQFMMVEGMRLVREGITSLQELKRALS
ncbi:MAG: ATPase, T2SS/T4P/T4SS family [Planctomycetia bacterium]|nr:ATPase, T2SS/T4P/T4SS family [Planctomycetia bacterium]